MFQIFILNFVHLIGYKKFVEGEYFIFEAYTMKTKLTPGLTAVASLESTNSEFLH